MTIRPRYRRALTVAACVLAAAAGAMPAAGTVVNSKVTLKVNRDTARFHGRVSSSFAQCVAGRKVVLYRDDGADRTKLAKTHATSRGRYGVHIPMQHGNRIFAVVKRFRAQPGLVCIR